jgi:hypothetical protein
MPTPISVVERLAGGSSEEYGGGEEVRDVNGKTRESQIWQVLCGASFSLTQNLHLVWSLRLLLSEFFI